MACGECGKKRGHMDNCSRNPKNQKKRPLRDPSTPGTGTPPPASRHKHSFTVHVRRGGGVVGPVYDVWRCSFPGCNKTETRNA